MTMRAIGGAAAAVMCTVVLFSRTGAAPGPTAAPPASAPADQVLTVPPGFVVERVAGPPLVDRPIVGDFDEEGRLYVADSSGSNDPVKKQLEDKPHRIVRLEDKNGDGVFDTSVVFADRMMFPEGTMWFDGSLYVAAPPSIWKLTDTNGDGVADRREEWFEGKTLTNCANDLHGPYLGPDGWIYWTKGAFAQQTYERPGKAPFVTRASHIFRRHPSSTAIEPVMNGGMDNPVDVAFTPAGERILTATFLEHPQLGRRDALIHAIYGGLYGKPHAVIEGHKRTGDLMPELSQLGPAVPSGLTRYASLAFGEDYRDNFFAAMFNLNKVTRHVLEAKGASFTSRDSDFLVSSSRDFHPTDVLEDADGSLLVLDTGAWYKLCCPSSQLAAPDVLGAIYRVRRQGAPKPADPRGLTLSWRTMSVDALTPLLGDARPVVQSRAVQQLAILGGAAIRPLAAVVAGRAPVEARRNAVWSLTRVQAPEARAAVRAALNDRDPSVRQAALHSVAVWKDAEALPQLLSALKSDVHADRRVAAEALGRIGDPRAVPALMALAALPLDRALEHSVIYALIEIADPASTATAAQDAQPSRARRAALIALDQMDGGGLKPETVVALLDSPDSLLKDTAWWIVERHPDWGPALAAYFQTRLDATTAGTPARDALQQKLIQFGENAAIQGLLAAIAERATTRDERVAALRAMARTRAKELPATWAAPLARALEDRDHEVVRQAISIVRAAPASKEAAVRLAGPLLRVARDPAAPLDLRLDALAAAPDGLTAVDPEVFQLLTSSLDSAKPVGTRLAAAGVLARARLDAAQLRAMIGVIERSGPLELPLVLRVFDQGSDESLGLALVAALRKSKARSSVRADVLRPRLEKYPGAVRAEADAFLASADLGTAKQGQRLEQLLASLGPGDVRRGQAIFNSPRTACLTCHAIGYLGGRIGPDLTRIGEIRSQRDLLEAIVFPNASFARGYEPVVIMTKAGESHTGVLRGDDKDEVVLATGERQETRIRRQDIVDMTPGTVSVMPPGLDEQLTREELADLLAFLKATRRGAD